MNTSQSKATESEDPNRRLYVSVHRGDVSAALQALDDGASPVYAATEDTNVSTASTPVMYVACKQHNLKIVELLLSRGADANAEYRTASVCGSEWEHCLIAAFPCVELVEVLLEHGASPATATAGWTEGGWSGDTAMELAARLNDKRILNLLVHHSQP